MFGWDGTPEREDADFSIAGDSAVTVAGTPDHIDIRVQIHLKIADNLSIQRPNQICRVTRNDGAIIGVSATGYIRDTADHEESSFNIAAMDTAPIANGTYTVTCQRETTNASVVPTVPESCKFQLKARFTP